MSTLLPQRPPSRRAFLHGSSALLALPLLESLGGEALARSVPKRGVWLGFSFGVSPHWYPEDSAEQTAQLSPSLDLLNDYADDISIVRDLASRHASNPHYGTTTLLTGGDIYGTPGSQLSNSISCDQIAAKHLGQPTRFSSLCLSSPKSCSQGSGGWGPGLSLSWTARGNPIPAITKPILLFERLFGDGKTKVEQRIYELKRKRSMLDSLVDQLRKVGRQLTSEDRERLDQYLHSIREVELQLVKEKEWVRKPYPARPASIPKPAYKPGSSAELDVMYHLMALAMQMDSTRVLTYRQASEGILQEIGFSSHGHALNHNRGDSNHKLADQRDQLCLSAFGRFLGRLRTIKEADGKSLLHHSLVTYSSEISVGHGMRDLPIVVAGRAGGSVRTGQHLRTPKGGPLSCLWLTQLQALGCPVDSFADGKRTLAALRS
ncbi:MAG: hypothetical protein ACI8QC_002546 [Planctomycetota bacterium]|jgi:hypothetical protein